MQLVDTTDPTRRGITLEEMDMGELKSKGWNFKSFAGSDGNWYEKGVHPDGRVRWLRLDDDN